MKSRLKLFLSLLVAGGLLIQSATIQSATAAEQVTVFAAASLTNALEEIAKDYEQGKEVKIVSSFASSSTLARQIEQGAPADIFVSADQKWMDYLNDKKDIESASRVTLLGNELVLIAPKGSKITEVVIDRQTHWIKLLDGGRLSVGDPDHVPVGHYAKEALQNLGAWATVEPLLARAENVRSALFLVERGEAPLGIVYASDAMISKKVQLVGRFPVDSYKSVEYPAAIIKGKSNPVVDGFFHYLSSDQAKTVFQRYGFRSH